MTFTEFIEKYSGIKTDFDGKWPGECVDLARMYIKEVTGTKQFSPVVGAKDIWNQEIDGFTKVANTPDGVPTFGSIVIWGSTYGKFGHVAICVGGTTSTFKAFSQNDPVGSLPSIKSYRSYKSVLGWFTPNQSSIINPPMPDADIRLKLLDENGLKSEGQTREAIDHHKGWDALQKDLKSSKDTIDQQKVSIDALTKSKEDLVMEISKLSSEAKLWKEKHESFVATIAKALGTTQDEARILPAIDELIAKADKLQDIVDERPVISASPIHKLLEEVIMYLKKLLIAKENGKS